MTDREDEKIRKKTWAATG